MWMFKLDFGDLFFFLFLFLFFLVSQRAEDQAELLMGRDQVDC
jgi:hypothetical protein